VTLPEQTSRGQFVPQLGTASGAVEALVTRRRHDAAERPRRSVQGRGNAPFDHRDLNGIVHHEARDHGKGENREGLPPG
jgi:hypothetical protein